MAAGESSKSFRHDNSPGSEDAENIVNFDNSRMIINKMATLYAEKIMSDIGKSFSEALILASTNPIWQKIVHWFTSSVHENYKLRTCCVHTVFP